MREQLNVNANDALNLSLLALYRPSSKIGPAQTPPRRKPLP